MASDWPLQAQGQTRAPFHILLWPSRFFYPLDSWHVAKSMFDIGKVLQVPHPLFFFFWKSTSLLFGDLVLFRLLGGVDAWDRDARGTRMTPWQINEKPILWAADWSGLDPDLLGLALYNLQPNWNLARFLTV